MGLYERDYARPGFDNMKQSESVIVSRIKETYKLFAASLMAGAIGVYTTLPAVATISQYFWPLVILEFIALFGLYFLKEKPGINLVMLFAFTFLTGVTSVPLISYALSISGGGAIIGNAFLMTSVIFGAMSFFAIKSTKDFTTFTKPMFIAILIIFAFSLINAIFLHNPIISIIISGIVVLVFSFMIIIDTQNIVKYNLSPIEGAISLYIDFLNIFLSLIQLFIGFNNDD